MPAFCDAKGFLQYGGAARIYESRIIGVLDKIEEGLKQGILEIFGGLFLALGILGQKFQDLIGCNVRGILIFEMVIEFSQEKPELLDRIFPPSSLSGNSKSW